MKRRTILGGAAVACAAALASIPAVLGLAGNPSFSQQVPVRPPQHARVLVLHDSEAPRAVPSRMPSTATSAATTRSDDDARGDDDADRDDRRGRRGRGHAEDG